MLAKCANQAIPPTIAAKNDICPIRPKICERNGIVIVKIFSIKLMINNGMEAKKIIPTIAPSVGSFGFCGGIGIDFFIIALFFGI